MDIEEECKESVRRVWDGVCGTGRWCGREDGDAAREIQGLTLGRDTEVKVFSVLISVVDIRWVSIRFVVLVLFGVAQVEFE